MRNRNNKIYGVIALLLVAAQLLAVIGSWLVAAAMPQAAMRSLILGAIAWGTVDRSRVVGALRNLKQLDYRQRFALRLVAAEAVGVAVVLLLLTAVPHAILLGVTGHLFPSSFSQGFIPTVCFCLTLFAVTYGMMSGTLRGTGGVFNALTAGFVQWRFVWPLYILSVQLWFSLKFILLL